MKVWYRKSLAIALLMAASIAAGAADPLQVRSLAASCATCHGTQGVAQEGMESLAGQTQQGLLQKMLDFKAGKKDGLLMHQLSQGYSDAQLEQLASHFAALKK